MKLNNLGILLILGTIFIGCQKDETTTEIIRPVKVLDLAKNTQGYTLTFPAITVPQQESALAFKVPGSIKSLEVEQGQEVKKGELIAKLDDSDYLINLESAKKQYDGAKANADNMIAQYKRAKIMYDGKAMSSKNFDIVTAQYKGALAMLKNAEQGVKNAQNKLKDSELRAPYSGYIGKKIVDKGSVVGAGTPVVTLTSKTEPKIVINIAGKDIEKIGGGIPKFVYNGKEYPAKVVEIGKTPDMLKLTYPVTLLFDGKVGEEILSGTTGDVKFSYATPVTTELLIPITALFEDNGSKVYIYDNGVVKTRAVVIGELYSGGNVSIKSGLNPNDKVITAGVHTISDGTKVKILPEPAPTNVGGVL